MDTLRAKASQSGGAACFLCQAMQHWSWSRAMRHCGYATFASALAACRLGGAGALLSSMLEATRR